MVQLATVQTTAPLSADEARALTDRIRQSVESLWSLLLEAHERKAHKALGYGTWESYVRAEFDWSRSYANRVLDQGRVIRELSEATGGMLPVGNITEREARDLKPLLPEVANEIRARVEAGDDPAEAVREVVEQKRAEVRAQPEQSDMTATASRPGPKIHTPEGKTVEDVVREGMEMEEAGERAEDAAEAVGLRLQTYRMARYIVLLTDRDDLSPTNQRIVAEARDEMNRAATIGRPFEMVEPLVNRIYGTGNRATPARAEAIQRANFDRAYGALIQACYGAPYVEVPHLSPEDASRVSAELKVAVQHLHDLRHRVEETVR